MTFAQAAQKAIELGGKYDGHELPEDINAFTKTSATALAGPGPDGRGARTTIRATAQSQSFVAGFAEVEVDVETGHVHDARLRGGRRRRHGASTRAASAARSSAARCSASATRSARSWVYDQHYGVALAKRFHHNKPPTILDAPAQLQWATRSTSPDPETPVGARGVGEPPVGAALRRGPERDLRTRSATRSSGARR